MGLGDPYINIAGLGPRSTIAGSDIIHIRSTGGVDSKMAITDLFNGIPVDIIQTAGVTSLKATTIKSGATGNALTVYGLSDSGTRQSIYVNDTNDYSSSYTYDDTLLAFQRIWIGHPTLLDATLSIDPTNKRATLFVGADDGVTTLQIGGSASVAGDITQTTGVASLKTTTITGALTVSQSSASLTTTRLDNNLISSSFLAGSELRIGDDLNDIYLKLRQSGVGGSKHHSYIIHEDNLSSNMYIQNNNIVGSIILQQNGIDIISGSSLAISLSKPTIVTGNISLPDNFVLNVGSNQGGGATIGYNVNGNLDIISRTGFNTDITTTRFLINAVDDIVHTLQVGGSGAFSGALTADTINTGYGDNNVLLEDIYLDRRTGSGAYTLPTIGPKQTAHVAVSASGSVPVNLPISGTYSFTYSNGSSHGSDADAPASQNVTTVASGTTAVITYRRLT